MPGEQNLEKLLASLSPVLMEEEYVFCTFQNARYGDHAELEPIASFMEPEGLTLVIPKPERKEHGPPFGPVFKGISLSVHSSLEAVGLTAALTRKLAEHGISANVIAAYYHDHIFVQQEHAGNAIQALQNLSDKHTPVISQG